MGGSAKFRQAMRLNGYCPMQEHNLYIDYTCAWNQSLRKRQSNLGIGCLEGRVEAGLTC